MQKKNKSTLNKQDAQLRALYNSLQAPTDKEGNLIPQGENAETIAKMMALATQPRVDMQNAVEVSDRTSFYFNTIAKFNIKPGLASYALCLGIGRDEIRLYRNGKKKCPHSVCDILDRAVSMISSCMEYYMGENKLNAVSGIFLMRNGLGYTNLDEADHSGMREQDRTSTAEELAEKYSDSIPD